MPVAQTSYGLQHSPLQDTERIFAMPDRAAREAALLTLEPDRRDMVSHFLVMRFAKALSDQNGCADLIAGVPEHLVADVGRLARSYITAALVVAARKA